MKKEMSEKEGVKRFKVHYLNNYLKLKKEIMELRAEKEYKKSLDEFMTIEEVKKEYKVSRKTIDRWRGSGLKTTQLKYGKLIRFKRRDVHEFLNGKSKL